MHGENYNVIYARKWGSHYSGNLGILTLKYLKETCSTTMNTFQQHMGCSRVNSP